MWTCFLDFPEQIIRETLVKYMYAVNIPMSLLHMYITYMWTYFLDFPEQIIRETLVIYAVNIPMSLLHTRMYITYMWTYFLDFPEQIIRETLVIYAVNIPMNFLYRLSARIVGGGCWLTGERNWCRVATWNKICVHALLTKYF